MQIGLLHQKKSLEIIDVERSVILIRVALQLLQKLSGVVVVRVVQKCGGFCYMLVLQAELQLWWLWPSHPVEGAGCPLVHGIPW